MEKATTEKKCEVVSTADSCIGKRRCTTSTNNNSEATATSTVASVSKAVTIAAAPAFAIWVKRGGSEEGDGDGFGEHTRHRRSERQGSSRPQRVPRTWKRWMRVGAMERADALLRGETQSER
jgi:hypothetical protein